MSTFNIANFMQVTEDGNHLSIWTASFNDMHRFVPSSSVELIGQQYAANLPGLAADKLGSRYLWWAILLYNGLYDPVLDVKPGTRVRIPDKDALIAYLQDKTSTRNSSNYRAALQPTLL